MSVRCFVLFVIMFGTLVSSLGLLSSHGLAALPTEHSSTALKSELHSESHSHSDQGDETIASLAAVAAVAEHPHHTSDHSHDKAHALPGYRDAASDLNSDWRPKVRTWIQTIQAYRLERPPMA